MAFHLGIARLMCQSNRLRILVALLALLVATVPVAASDAQWPKSWISKGLVAHPLAGKIFASRANKFIEPKAYLQSLVWPRFVLLGEVHDNPDHHVLQGLAVRSLGGGQPTVIFEHFQTNQQSLIDVFQAGLEIKSTDDPIARLFLVTGWQASGWPDQKTFRPLVRAVFDRRARIVAGNPPRGRAREVARGGLAALSEDAQRSLLLNTPLGAELQDDLLGVLEASHCGLMPKSAFGNMAVAQRFRDGHMARAMADAAVKREGPVVLVAGNGHARLDLGVAWYLRKMISDAKARPLISVGHIEVVEGKTQPADYADALSQYSIVVFTPRKIRKDPCVEMRKKFGGHKRK